MRGEHRSCPGDLDCRVEVQGGSVLGDRELTDPLETQEARVALVGVEDLRLDRTGDPREGADGTDAADTEQQLLEETVLGGAAVEPVGDLP